MTARMLMRSGSTRNSTPGFVPRRGLDHLRLRGRMEPDRNHPIALYARANTSDASRSSTAPSSVSLHRFRISSRQASEISVPGSASRLSRSRSATNARASGESRSASLITAPDTPPTPQPSASSTRPASPAGRTVRRERSPACAHRRGQPTAAAGASRARGSARASR